MTAARVLPHGVERELNQGRPSDARLIPSHQSEISDPIYLRHSQVVGSQCKSRLVGVIWRGGVAWSERVAAVMAGECTDRE